MSTQQLMKINPGVTYRKGNVTGNTSADCLVRLADNSIGSGKVDSSVWKECKEYYAASARIARKEKRENRKVQAEVKAELQAKFNPGNLEYPIYRHTEENKVKKSNKVKQENAKVSRTVRKTVKPNGHIYTVISTVYADGTVCSQSKIDFKKAV
jgi:hypothetical protein